MNKRVSELFNFLNWAAIIGYLFLYIPLTVVILFSFNDSKLNAEWVGFSLSWYKKLLDNPAIQTAALNSLIVAITSSLLATLLGTMAGYALYRYKSRILPFLILTPMALPEILVGVSMLIFFVMLGWDLGLFTIIISHAAFSIGFVAVVVRSRLAGLDESLLEAAQDLGASGWQTFRFVTFPLIMPGVIAGFLLAFTLSIDDFVITFFTAGVDSVTLPLQIYSMIKVAVTPEVNAISTILLMLTATFAILAAKLSPNILKGG
jgi:spermidine/putrescine transport system permease protein